MACKNCMSYRPDLTVVEKLSADGVTAPAIPLTIDVDGVEQTFLANEYWSYDTSSGDIDQVGTWIVAGQYIDITPKSFCGSSSTFIVLSCT